jgi:hypothetical protein
MLPSTNALLTAIVDYAGLFPPAKLDLWQAMANYVQYASTPERWLLGRFVLPASRLDQFQSLLPEFSLAQWSLSVIVEETSIGLEQVQSCISYPQIAVRALEFLPLAPGAIAQVLPLLPTGVEAFFEVPWNSDLDAVLQILQSTQAAIKLRTGGITAEAFPSSFELGKAILGCARAQVPFKATAGLHHPLPTIQRLTDDPDSATVAMHGALNVALLAALTFQQTIPLPEAVVMLEAGEIQDNFQFLADGIVWGDRTLSLAELEAARHHCFRSFGSCSFKEPVEDLKALQLID